LRGVVKLCLCGEIASSARFVLLNLIQLKRRTRYDGGGNQDSRFKIQDGRRKIEEHKEEFKHEGHKEINFVSFVKSFVSFVLKNMGLPGTQLPVTHGIRFL
jgi:hypothetical protein